MGGQDERLGNPEGGAKPPRKGRLSRAEEATRKAAQLPDAESSERMETELDMAEQDGPLTGEDWDDEDDAVIELFLDSLNQSVLPRLPEIPGYHICWLTTSNPKDTVEWRQRLGYTVLRYSDFPDMPVIGGLKGDTDPSGVIKINEMVAAKIPLRRYNKLMLAVGHTLPLNEEQKLRGDLEQMAEDARSRGARVMVGDGNRDIVQDRAKPPVFAS